MEKMEKRASVNLPPAVAGKLLAVAKTLGQSANAVGTALIDGGLTACDAASPELPQIVQIYRRQNRKDLDPIERTALRLVRKIWPGYDQEILGVQSIMQTLLAEALESGVTLDRKNVIELQKKAVAMRRKMEANAKK